MDIIAEANKIIEQAVLNTTRQREAESVFVTFVSAGYVVYNLYQQKEPMRVLFSSMLEIFCEKGYKVEKSKFIDHYSNAIEKLDQQKGNGIDDKDIQEILTLYFNRVVWGKAVS